MVEQSGPTGCGAKNLQGADPQKVMPRYRCHKEVHALKIGQITPVEWHQLNGEDRVQEGALLFAEEAGYAPIPVGADYLAKHQPCVGGYYVVYADGYRSFSPAQAFEEGYARIDG